jgi:hypothetical protein
LPQEGGGGFPLIAATRTAGVPVIYVSVGFRKGYPEVSKNNTIFASIKENGVFMADNILMLLQQKMKSSSSNAESELSRLLNLR